MEKIDRPSKKMKAAHQMAELSDTLWGGTNAIKSKALQYLPREPKEKPENWRMRVNRSPLTNYFKKTIEINAGRVFKKPSIVKGETPEQIVELFDDIDLCGQTLDGFSKEQLKNGLRHGISYILVEYPKTPQGFSLYDEKRYGFRPYWVSITMTQVLEIVSSQVDGAERLVHFKFIETVEPYSMENAVHTTGTQPANTNTTVPGQTTGYQQNLRTVPTQVPVDTNQIKELHFNEDTKKVEYKIYRKKKSTIHDSSEYEWKEVESGIIEGVSRIPVAPVYTNRTGFFLGECPLQDLAELNLTHYQSSSDQRNILHTARVPILFAKMMGMNEAEDGRQTPKEVTISPNTTLVSNDPAADVKWIEPKGDAIQAGRDDLKDLEDQMKVLGLDFVVSSRPGTTTATEKAINTAENSSHLQSMVLGLEEGVNNALEITAEFLKISFDGGVEFNKEFDLPFHNDKDMEYLFEMYREGMITAGDLIEEAKRRSILNQKHETPEEIQNKEYVEPVQQVNLIGQNNDM